MKTDTTVKRPGTVSEPAGEQLKAFGVTTLPGARVNAGAEAPGHQGAFVSPTRLDFPCTTEDY